MQDLSINLFCVAASQLDAAIPRDTDEESSRPSHMDKLSEFPAAQEHSGHARGLHYLRFWQEGDAVQRARHFGEFCLHQISQPL